MMNPYLGKTRKQRFVMAGTGEPLPGVLTNRGGSKIIADSGEINAYSKQEVAAQIGELMMAVANKKVVHQKTKQEVNAEKNELKKKRHEQLISAMSDRNGESFTILGEVIGDEIWTTMNREGFLRKVFMYNPIGKGEEARLRVRQKDVIGYQVTGPSSITPSVVRQKWVYPPEFTVGCHIWIDEKELAQSTGDLLEEKYQDGLEQIMVVEDRIYRMLANTSAGITNTLVYFNTLTPSVFSGLRQQILDWGIPVSSAILASDLWNDIIADTSFSDWFEPVTKHELILEGTLGSLLGTELHTDAFREPNLKVLNRGEIFFNGAPETLGGILQRQEIQSKAVDNYVMSRAERGWFLFEIVAMALVNARAITKGQRI